MSESDPQLEPPTGGQANTVSRVLAGLDPRGKEPVSAAVLERWVAKVGSDAQLDGGRLGHLIAATVVVAALQRAVDETGRSRFLLKGGTYLQHRLQASSRPTRDVDGLVRGDMDDFIRALDEALQQDWGPLSLSRNEVETIDVPGKLIKPRRLSILLAIRGKTWRKVKVEIAPDEAGAGDEYDQLVPVRLDHFGLPTPARLIGIAIRFQVAQKLHAVSDRHAPPTALNDRVRDVLDLLLLREVIASEQVPTLQALRSACVAVFAARCEEAAQMGHEIRPWPPQVVAHPHWAADYPAASRACNVNSDLPTAVAEVSAWIREIDTAGG